MRTLEIGHGHGIKIAFVDQHRGPGVAALAAEQLQQQGIAIDARLPALAVAAGLFALRVPFIVYAVALLIAASLVAIFISGSALRPAEGAPVLAVRVQELYGLSIHPALARGRAPLTLHLLSPAHRPIQITRDLPGFWRGSWASVKSDMKGRYPRHLWPDDPAGAAPTARAKPRGT